jgi:hypothetical protein
VAEKFSTIEKFISIHVETLISQSVRYLPFNHCLSVLFSIQKSIRFAENDIFR